LRAFENELGDRQQRQHWHVPLVGLVEGEKVVYTALAAKYPEALCNHLVKEFVQWRGQSQRSSPQWWRSSAGRPSSCRPGGYAGHWGLWGA